MRVSLTAAPRRVALALMLATALPLVPVAVPAAQAQSAPDKETLADIRQQLTVVYVEIQKLKREMSTTGASGDLNTNGSQLDRIDALEQEVRRLTDQTEEMNHHIGEVVKDGTQRIGDLEFRLVELEGGDVSKLGNTTTLGEKDPGGNDAQADKTADAVTAPPADANDPQLAVSEQGDFEAAQKKLDGKDYAGAVTAFDSFKANYPGSPLAPAADLGKGRALEQQGDIKTAARAYLDSFSAAPKAKTAPVALYRLGRLLNQLGQKQEACTTLNEVGRRFPESDAAIQASKEMKTMSCQ
ncbi:tol-pal system protein YbgF [Pseudooceanicola sp. CBS1P-1]|uniref:Cell division coordinator CpoB n=1 Tax=Pseudooceanicola albus TaxID=2692189 RepID=A0A6L7G172_9RHOB|nr:MULTISPECIES: tol-pal system protein YbgF [Pseudooceanicola]MBT9382700.1 tol-pal system protein YbgF [Pseudooceanicola endophyticus]MXN17238.1 tol-pal system protein YbgF [Pseudooceanicola albus]